MKPKLIVAAFICIILTSSCNYFKKHRLFSRDVDTILDMTIDEPEVVQEEIIDSTEFYAEESFSDAYMQEEPAYIAPSGNRYHMIVGSFQNENLANTYANKVQQMGYQSEVIASSNGFYRVSAKSYSNYQEGIGDINNFRSAFSTNAWLHVKP